MTTRNTLDGGRAIVDATDGRARATDVRHPDTGAPRNPARGGRCQPA